MCISAIPIEIDVCSNSNEEWKKIISKQLKIASHFEIHCWNDEKEEITLALKYGNRKDSDWEYGKIISGDVTKDFKDFILSIPKPTDTEIYNKMTPFFSIFLDNGTSYFSSSHYGTEMYKWKTK